MQPSDILKTVEDIEERFPVKTWTVNGIHVWPLIRLKLKNYLFVKTHQPEIGKKLCFFKRIYYFLSGQVKYYCAYIADSRHNASLKDAAPVIFFTYSAHRVLLKNKWFDRYCDPFIGCFRSWGLNTLTIETGTPTYSYRIPRFSDSMYIQKKVDLIKALNRLFPKKYFEENLNELNVFLSFLGSGDYKGLNISVGQLRQETAIILDIADYFKSHFVRVKPKLAFIADFYSSLESMGFLIACRQSNIRCIDIQHGTIGAYHLAYNGWLSVPESGYELLPDVFWCWSKEDVDEIQKWSHGASFSHQAYAGSNLWLNLWNDPHNDIVQYYDGIMMNYKSKNKNVRYAVYTFDMYFGLPDWVIAVIKSTSPHLFWWIRLHPSQLSEGEAVRKTLRENGVTNFDLDFATDMPLPVLFRHCDIHITATSSSIKEAAYFSVPSIFTHPDGADHHRQEVTSGMAMKACTLEDLMQVLKEQISKKSAPEVKKVVFESNDIILKRFLDTFGINL